MLQDEERADLARDLHDEIGPHLFAVNIDAAMLGQSLAAGRQAEAAERVKAIQAAVGHMQRQVRDILSRLRPTQLVELGLDAAIGDLVRFWRARRADISFTVDLAVDEAALSDAAAGDRLPHRPGEPQQRRPPRPAGGDRRRRAPQRAPETSVSVRVVDDGVGRKAPHRQIRLRLGRHARAGRGPGRVAVDRAGGERRLVDHRLRAAGAGPRDRGGAAHEHPLGRRPRHRPRRAQAPLARRPPAR